VVAAAVPLGPGVPPLFPLAYAAVGNEPSPASSPRAAIAAATRPVKVIAIDLTSI
jgi:hypothetical protein